MHNEYQNKMMRSKDGSILEDKTIRCSDCGKEFVFEAGEQAYYERNNFNDPKRCRRCREMRKQKTI